MGEEACYGGCIPDGLANGGSSEGNDMSIGQPPIVRYKVPNDQAVEPQQHIRCQKGPRLGATGASLGEIRSRPTGSSSGRLAGRQASSLWKGFGHCANQGTPWMGAAKARAQVYTPTHPPIGTRTHTQRQIVTTGRQRGGSRFLAPRPSI